MRTQQLWASKDQAASDPAMQKDSAQSCERILLRNPYPKPVGLELGQIGHGRERKEPEGSYRINNGQSKRSQSSHTTILPLELNSWNWKINSFVNFIVICSQSYKTAESPWAITIHSWRM